jgi:hypothetical protein
MTYSLSFWSEDYSGNVEAATTVSFTVTRDVTPPTTTCDAVEGATYTMAQTFNLAGTDTGTGVAGTWYKLDGATGFTRYTTGIRVALPPSGAAGHTISWYSVDNAGNAEPIKTVSFSMSTVAAVPEAPVLIGLPPDYGLDYVWDDPASMPPVVTLQWNPVTAPDGHPCTYLLYLVSRPNGVAFKFTNVTPILVNGTSYAQQFPWSWWYWQVRAVDSYPGHEGLISAPSSTDWFRVFDQLGPTGSPYLGPYN